MMEAGGSPAEVLMQCPWLPVCISGCQLLAKSCFGETAYHILLTDMTCVWEEKMDAAAIQCRAQELNRRLRASARAFFSHLCEVAQPCLMGGDARMSLTRLQGGDISMRLKSELAGLPFYWEFHCSQAPVALACGQLVHPLLLMCRLLQKQAEQLGSLLLRKDAEIQDYRENGATLSRERLQTDVFEEQTYREDFISKALPQVCSGQQEGLGFNSELQDLYRSIVAHGNTNTRKRKPSERRSSEENRPGPELAPSPGEAAMSGETGEANREEGQNGRKDEDGAKMAAAAAEQQSRADPASPAARPASRPKKKKAAGLFR